MSSPRPSPRARSLARALAPSLRRALGALCALGTLGALGTAHAATATGADETPAAGAPTNGRRTDALRLDDGRHPYETSRSAGLWLETHGEAQLRAERWSALPLGPPASDRTLTSLGQRSLGTEWIRIGARAGYRDSVALVTQIDLVPRWIVGDLAQGLAADRAWAQDDAVPAIARLRFLYLDVKLGPGMIRVGQVGAHWGMGVLTNDGDHPSLFGDYRLGSLVERLSFSLRPLGERSPFVVAIAADAILQDATSRWTDGDRAYQGVAQAYWERGETFVGVYGARRGSKVRAFGNDGRLDVWILDATARHAAELGVDDAFVYAEGEIASVFGHGDAVRATAEVMRSDVRSWGAAGRVGVVKRAKADGVSFGRIAVELEAGFASGDGDPYDGTQRRFGFDPNHLVGLVLFPFVMRAQTARSATNSMDPALGAHPSPGAFLLATHGGVAGAEYVFPTIVVRPASNFDVKFGALVAVASSDFVDPYATTIQGSARNARGGDAHARDLGLELDWGFEWRAPIGEATLQLGLQQGVLFPGHAFDDAQGRSMPWQSVTQGRVGLQY
jgi:hypothetical protein